MINPTKETIDMLKGTLGNPQKQDLRKGVSISTGLTWYDLQAPAKNLYPIITPLRNSVPRVHRPHSGAATNWKQVSALTGSGFDAMGWVPEGQRAGSMSYTTANKAASYVTIGEEDYLTFEAEAAAEGFEDENAMVTFRLLQKMMRKEEMAILGGNAGGVALGTPGTITMSASGSSGSLTGGTYYAKVVALTFEGYKNSSLTGGVATTKTITGMDGKSFTLNGGSSILEQHAIPERSLDSGRDGLCVVRRDQLRWRDLAGNQHDQQCGDHLDHRGSSGCFGSRCIGLFRQRQLRLRRLADQLPEHQQPGVCELPGDGHSWHRYGTHRIGAWFGERDRYDAPNDVEQLQRQPDGSLRQRPGVEEHYHQGALQHRRSSAPLRHSCRGGGQYEITAGGTISFYFNPFSLDGGMKLPIKIHPDLPPGTILAYAERLPIWYQSNEVPNVAEVVARRDYYRMDWPLVTRQRQYGVYAETVLAVYASFAMGVLSNIANG
jgi:hypothetical protein